MGISWSSLGMKRRRAPQRMSSDAAGGCWKRSFHSFSPLCMCCVVIFSSSGVRLRGRANKVEHPPSAEVCYRTCLL